MASGIVVLFAACGLDEGGLGQAPPARAGSQDGEGGSFAMGGAEDAVAPDSTALPFDAAGSGDAAPPGDTTPSGDASSTQGVDSSGPATVGDGSCGTDSSACVDVPSGWTLVAFASAQSSACPAGFTGKSTDLVEGPTTGAGACGCGACTVTSPPTCNSGSVPVHYDNITSGAGTCSLVATPGTGPLMNSAGSCGTDLYQGSYGGFDVSYASPPPAGGACTAPGVASGGGVTYAAQDRACSADGSLASCNGSLCSPSIASPFKACIMATGAAPCPTGPMSVRHAVGTSASLTCADCSCSIAADCSGTVTLYTDSSCTKGPYAVPADGSCNPIYKQKASYNSYIYAGGSPRSVVCSASIPAAPSVALVNPATICCAP